MNIHGAASSCRACARAGLASTLRLALPVAKTSARVPFVRSFAAAPCRQRQPSPSTARAVVANRRIRSDPASNLKRHNGPPFQYRQGVDATRRIDNLKPSQIRRQLQTCMATFVNDEQSDVALRIGNLLVSLSRTFGLQGGELLGLARKWAASLSQSQSASSGESNNALGGQFTDEVQQDADIDSIIREVEIYGRQTAIDRAVLQQFFQWLNTQVTENLVTTSPSLSAIIAKLDMKYPAEWYLGTRSERRKIIMHVGPTNSGKTYNALCRLAQARVGVFAGPLRLLASEVYNRFNAGTIGGLKEPRICNLSTGDEVRIHDIFAGLESCTVEMINLGKRYDVAVIDEIQLIADPGRGSSWTQALLGIEAKEVHVCGEASVVEMVQRIGKACGDEVIVNRYERLSPLTVASQSLHGDLSKVVPGDCVVTFSRNNIFALKQQIEQKTGLRVAVAYGGLPPEVREEQARGFNSASATNGYDVLVASDAIGMGLNLKIKRIIFETVHKFNGTQEVELSASQIKQLAGRAGRYGMGSDSPSAPDELPNAPTHPSASRLVQDTSNGVVTCLLEADMPILVRAMQAPMRSLQRAALHPSVNQLQQLMALLPSNVGQSKIFELLPIIAATTRDYYIPSFGHLLTLSKQLEPFKSISIQERWLLSHSPVSQRDPVCVSAIRDFMARFDSHKPMKITEWIGRHRFDILLANFRSAEDEIQKQRMDLNHGNRAQGGAVVARFTTSLNLTQLESLHRTLVMYLWLGRRFSLHFPEASEARLLKLETEKAIDFILLHMRSSGGQQSNSISRFSKQRATRMTRPQQPSPLQPAAQM